MKAPVSVPPGLDQVVRQHLTRVIGDSLQGDQRTRCSPDDLSRLSAALSADRRRDIYRVTLYGYELAMLYAFLLEQEPSYALWSADLVPARASRAIHAQLRGLLPTLHALCRRVDVFADRPVHTRPLFSPFQL